MESGRLFGFLLCLSLVSMVFGKDGKVGGCEYIDANDAENDNYLKAGIQLLSERLAEKVNAGVGYTTVVKMPDMKTCSQVVAGTLYHIYWKTQETTTKCVNDPKSNALCEKEKEKTSTTTVDCEATYWVKPWELKENYAGGKLEGPMCPPKNPRPE